MLGPVGKIACILDERFDRWVQGLEARHLAELTFQELSRSVRALSSTYVERRRGLGSGAALAGAGKRAAFALFYGPLHYLLIREIVRALGGTIRVHSAIGAGSTFEVELPRGAPVPPGEEEST